MKVSEKGGHHPRVNGAAPSPAPGNRLISAGRGATMPHFFAGSGGDSLLKRQVALTNIFYSSVRWNFNKKEKF
jgi:hypothetical protein